MPLPQLMYNLFGMKSVRNAYDQADDNQKQAFWDEFWGKINPLKSALGWIQLVGIMLCTVLGLFVLAKIGGNNG